MFNKFMKKFSNILNIFKRISYLKNKKVLFKSQNFMNKNTKITYFPFGIDYLLLTYFYNIYRLLYIVSLMVLQEYC